MLCLLDSRLKTTVEITQKVRSDMGGGYAGPSLPEPPAGDWPSDTPNFDFDIATGRGALSNITVTDPAKPDTRLSELPGYQQDPSGGMREEYRQAPGVPIGYEDSYKPTLFEWAHMNLQYADDNVARDIPEKWDAIKTTIRQAVQDFKDRLRILDSGGDPWKGETRRAAQQNFDSSFDILESIAAGANELFILNDAFSRTLGTVKNNIESNWPSYNIALNDFENSRFGNHRDYIVQAYDGFARNVIQHVYNPYISNISNINDNLSFNSGSPPAVSGANLTGSPLGGLGGGGGPVGGGGPLGSGGSLGAPVGAPGLGGGAGIPRIPAPAQMRIGPSTPPSQIPTGASPATAAPTSGLDPSALAAPLMGAAAPAQALGQLASMAGQAGNPGARNAANGLGKPPPEGTLNLGPKSAKGGGAGGIGGGVGARTLAIGKPAGAPSAAAGTAASRTVAAGSRAGLGSAMGSPAAGAPGAGAPAAGHQGAAQGAQYQPNKALRRKKNGEELIGDVQAAMAVLGEPERPETAKPEAT